MEIANLEKRNELESTDEVVVQVQGLEKIFRDFWGRPKAKAVNGVEFEVRSGRCSDCWDQMDREIHNYQNVVGVVAAGFIKILTRVRMT